MFKCWDSRRDAEAILLDDEWVGEKLEALRATGRVGALLCPQCRQPVIVRAGEEKKRHFAHKSLGTCPLQFDSPAILRARSLLYKWLQTKLAQHPATVTLETRLNENLPRPIDCYVEFLNGPKIAYCLLGKGIREREEFRACFNGIKLNVVFLSALLKPVQTEDGSDRKGKLFDLSMTERDFLFDFTYSALYRGKSLQYLDSITGVVTTLRGIELFHAPQRHSVSAVLRNPLAEMLMNKSGRLIHPGEYEAFKAMDAARALELKQRAEQARDANLKREQARQKREAERAAIWEAKQTGEPPWKHEQRTLETEPVIQKTKVAEPFLKARLTDKDLTCRGCGKQTSEIDWVNAAPAEGVCLCRDCYEIQERERLRKLRQETS